MDKNTVRNMVKHEPEVLQNASLFRARLVELCPDEEMLCELIAMALDESIPYRMKTDKVSSAEEYAVQIADLFGCTERTAMAVAEIWLAAIPALPEKREYPGRRKCDTLKAIRKKIAEANGIPFFTEECSHEGPCRGTCPKCDAEIEYLNRELQMKMDQGEEVFLEGLCINDLDEYQEAMQSIHINTASINVAEYGHMNVPVPEPQSIDGLFPVIRGSTETEIYDPVEGIAFFDTSIDEIELPVRTYNTLKRAGINTVEEVCIMTENELLDRLQRFRIGPKEVQEIKDNLKKLGCALRSDPEKENIRMSEVSSLMGDDTELW